MGEEEESFLSLFSRVPLGYFKGKENETFKQGDFSEIRADLDSFLTTHLNQKSLKNTIHWDFQNAF